MRKTIGVMGGAFKPFHAGHYAAVSKVANETDEVVLFVSNKDRAKKNEFPLLWKNMEKVWKLYLEGALPGNVTVHYVGNPVRAIYELLETAEKDENNHNTYVIYASGEDLAGRFSEAKLEKYFPRLYSEAQVEGKETGTRGLGSGTAMRQHLQNDDLENFVSQLPAPVQRYGQDIWDILKNV